MHPDARGDEHELTRKSSTDKGHTLREAFLISGIIETSTRGSRHEFCNEIFANISVCRVSYVDVRKHSHAWHIERCTLPALCLSRETGWAMGESGAASHETQR